MAVNKFSSTSDDTPCASGVLRGSFPVAEGIFAHEMMDGDSMIPALPKPICFTNVLLEFIGGSTGNFTNVKTFRLLLQSITINLPDALAKPDLLLKCLVEIEEKAPVAEAAKGIIKRQVGTCSLVKQHP